ncbi:MAG: peptidase MA family metallohydrolase, partial [Anaerolineales bacterium]
MWKFIPLRFAAGTTLALPARASVVIALTLSVSLLTVTPAFASPALSVTSEARRKAAAWTTNEIILNFPESATFRASFTSDVDITSVELEYGNEQQTCGEVVAKGFPQFTPGKTVDAEWTWEMRQSGSLPPGAQLWWRWRVTDANGQETVTETQTATWLDDIHDWQSMNNGEYLRLHWYEGDQTFATDLAKAAYNGLLFNETQSGLKAEEPIDIYVYASTDDLKEAILYEPSWTGGQAFPDQNIVI